MNNKYNLKYIKSIRKSIIDKNLNIVIKKIKVRRKSGLPHGKFGRISLINNKGE